MTDVRLWAVFCFPRCSVVSVLVSLPPCELSSTLLAFFLFNSLQADLLAAGSSLFVKKCSIKHSVRHVPRDAGQTNTQTHYKQEQADERKGGFMRDV